MFKKILVLFFIGLIVSILFSCTKGSTIKKNIEGTWGLTHYESYDTMNGETSQEIYNCNPFTPLDSKDQKLEIINTNGEEYLCTSYSWDKKKSDWVTYSGNQMIWIFKGNKIIMKESEDAYFLFHLDSDFLTIESTIEEEYESLGEKITYSNRSKVIYRKMSGLAK